MAGDLVTIPEGAVILKVSESTIKRWRVDRLVTPVRPVGDGTRALLYDLDDLVRVRVERWRGIPGNSSRPESYVGQAGVIALSHAASLRLAVIAANARIAMWQASPAMDKARNAERVLEEVRLLLEPGRPAVFRGVDPIELE